MPSTTCAFCGRLSHMTRKWVEFVSEGGGYTVQGVATCDNCGRASIGLRRLGPTEAAHSPEARFDEYDIQVWYPHKGVSPNFPDVPAHIAVAAKEAHSASSIGAQMAAILMARTVVEATAKAHQIASGTLFDKIDAMQDAQLIRKSTAEAAHEIRHLGNDMAHGDITEIPGAEDASEVLELMDEVLNEVFQGPAKTKRIKEKRTAAGSDAVTL